MSKDKDLDEYVREQFFYIILPLLKWQWKYVGLDVDGNESGLGEKRKEDE